MIFVLDNIGTIHAHFVMTIGADHFSKRKIGNQRNVLAVVLYFVDRETGETEEVPIEFISVTSHIREVTQGFLTQVMKEKLKFKN